MAEAMTLAEYGVAIAQRRDIRAQFAALAPTYDGVVTLPATGPAPLGLSSTGNPVFAVPFSLLGVPTVSLPLLAAEGLPLGLQVVGFEGGDARLFAIAAWVRDLLQADG
jgi:Asp-tRNA(Asn)/Glu-tRNA(Gln) amidotransferase A subunit family amidase